MYQLVNYRCNTELTSAKAPLSDVYPGSTVLLDLHWTPYLMFILAPPCCSISTGLLIWCLSWLYRVARSPLDSLSDVYPGSTVLLDLHWTPCLMFILALPCCSISTGLLIWCLSWLHRVARSPLDSLSDVYPGSTVLLDLHWTPYLMFILALPCCSISTGLLIWCLSWLHRVARSPLDSLSDVYPGSTVLLDLHWTPYLMFILALPCCSISTGLLIVLLWVCLVRAPNSGCIVRVGYSVVLPMVLYAFLCGKLPYVFSEKVSCIALLLGDSTSYVQCEYPGTWSSPFLMGIESDARFCVWERAVQHLFRYGARFTVESYHSSLEIIILKNLAAAPEIAKDAPMHTTIWHWGCCAQRFNKCSIPNHIGPSCHTRHLPVLGR